MRFENIVTKKIEWERFVNSIVLINIDSSRKLKLPENIEKENQAFRDRYRDQLTGYPGLILVNSRGKVVYAESNPNINMGATELINKLKQEISNYHNW